MLIKVDIDGVLRDWNHSLIRVFKKHYPDAAVTYPFDDFVIKPHFPKDVDVRNFYLNEAYEDVYLNAEPYPGALDFIRAVVDAFPHVWLVTTQYPNTMYPTIRWVEDRLPTTAMNVPIVFSAAKGSIGKYKFRGNTVLVDDAPHNLADQADHGGIAVAFGQSYNYNRINGAMPVFADYDFSDEHEPERVKEQFRMTFELLLKLYEARWHGA